MKTARLLGINEVTISKIRDGIMPKVSENISSSIPNIFLYLNDLKHNRKWNQE